MVMDDVFTTDHGLGRVVADALPDEVAVAFDLQGEGGGVWTIIRHGQDVSVQRSRVDPIDCKVRCTVADFRALLEGHLDGRAGFLDGRLEVEGDVGLVLRMQQKLIR
jgi:putative sterol carrier protein